ncbi:MAG: GNAT family N-acetyltransferase [Lentisphaerae bacterium]|nr:GNAT family N-acetyltransferase [Lentisphaerota bacterium]
MTLKFIELKTPESLQVIRDIAASIWPETFREILSPEQITYMMEMMYAPAVMEKELADGYHFDIVCTDDLPAGYMVYSSYAPETAKLHKLYLLSRYHGRGIGSAMLDHVANQTRKLGFKNLILNVNKHNVKAINAYERNNFTTIEAVKIDIGNGFFMDDFVMKKVL